MFNKYINNEEINGDTMTKICPYCGETIDADSRFCDNCGEEIIDKTNQTTENKSFIEKNKIPLIIIGITALIVFTVVFITSSGSTGVLFPLESNETQQVEVDGVYFNIPADYMLDPSSVDFSVEGMVFSASKQWKFNLEGITIMIMSSSVPLTDYGDILAANGGTPTTMYGHEGYLIEEINCYSFVFEENGKICLISVTSPYIFNEISLA